MLAANIFNLNLSETVRNTFKIDYTFKIYYWSNKKKKEKKKEVKKE